MKNVTVVEHPLVQHKLSLMRRKETPTAMFRQLIRELSMLLGYEVTRDLPMGKERIETPIMEMDAPVLTGKKLVFISVLRAGNGLLEGLLDLIPSARVGHVGMLATANSAIAAVQRVKEAGARDIKFVCLLAAPEGIEAFQQAHPDVQIITAAIDHQLNDHGYIVPGLGDAGDRIYGTK
jgi:uracil phosphoribosyltransferase